MKPLASSTVLFLTLSVAAAHAADADPTRVLPDGQKPQDARIGKVRSLEDKDFDFTAPASLKDWEARRQALREQVLVADGLWPMPEKTPLNPVVHGKIDRDDYTIEKVFFASYAGALRQRQPLPAQGQRPANCPASSARTATGTTAASTTSASRLPRSRSRSRPRPT